VDWEGEVEEAVGVMGVEAVGRFGLLEEAMLEQRFRAVAWCVHPGCRPALLVSYTSTIVSLFFFV